MKHANPSLTLLAGAALLTGAAQALPAEALPVETDAGLWAEPYAVEVETVPEGTVVRGELRQLSSSPRRRLVGHVEIEVLDAEGRVIAKTNAEPHRASPARHTRHGRFEALLGPLPEAASSLRVRYR